MMWNYQRTAVVHRKFISAITLMLQTHNTIGHLFQCHAVMTNEHLDTDYWRVQQLNIEQSLTITCFIRTLSYKLLFITDHFFKMGDVKYERREGENNSI